jgi:hypothetical protein
MLGKLFRVVTVAFVLVLDILIQSSSADLIDPMEPMPTDQMCPVGQCAFGTGCYSHGACLGCQRCDATGTPERWRDDKTCPGCKQQKEEF